MPATMVEEWAAFSLTVGSIGGQPGITTG